MRQKGKHGKLWDKTRAEWIKLNPPNHQGYYICWICGIWVPAGEMEVDHIKSRTRFPELRYVLSNLAPSCHKCNEAKGSRKYTAQEVISEPDLIDNIW